MAVDPNAAAAVPPTPSIDPAEVAARENWFINTPDPWSQIALLEFGGDRTLASDVEQIIRHAEPNQHADLEARMLAVFARPELTEAGRIFVCRMLGLIGSKACVPAVARLLDDNHTADVARLALDHIADPSVDEAYRNALRKLSGRAKAGLIGSLALRGASPSELSASLQHVAIDASETPEVRHAAERALARLGSKR
jgi:hypothetical protein